MSIRALIARNPFFQAIKARDNFVATFAVTLGDWRQLDAASWWCEERWRDYRLHYRRRVFADLSRAVFEFEDDCHAIEFLMGYGSRCREL